MKMRNVEVNNTVKEEMKIKMNTILHTIVEVLREENNKDKIDFKKIIEQQREKEKE